MIKTTVYLSDALKAALKRFAAEAGSSEAEVIREGIHLAIARHQPPTPKSGIYASGEQNLSDRVDERLVGFGES